MKHLLAAILSLGSFFHPHHKSPTEITDKVSESLVRLTGTIHATGWLGEEFEAHYTCTAFAIADHSFMTAAHCMGNDMKGDDAAATALKVDKVNDLALLKIDLPRPAVKFRPSAVARGEDANGLGYGYSFKRFIVTYHKVVLTDFSPSNPDDEDVLTPGLWMGNGVIGGMSGGPFVDKDGLVIGIVQRGSPQVGYGVGYDIIKAFLVGTGVSI